MSRAGSTPSFDWMLSKKITQSTSWVEMKRLSCPWIARLQDLQLIKDCNKLYSDLNQTRAVDHLSHPSSEGDDKVFPSWYAAMCTRFALILSIRFIAEISILAIYWSQKQNFELQSKSKSICLNMDSSAQWYSVNVVKRKNIFNHRKSLKVNMLYLISPLLVFLVDIGGVQPVWP